MIIPLKPFQSTQAYRKYTRHAQGYVFANREIRYSGDVCFAPLEAAVYIFKSTRGCWLVLPRFHILPGFWSFFCRTQTRSTVSQVRHLTRWGTEQTDSSGKAVNTEISGRGECVWLCIMDTFTYVLVLFIRLRKNNPLSLWTSVERKGT